MEALITTTNTKPLPVVAGPEDMLQIRLNPSTYPQYQNIPEENRMKNLKAIMLSAYMFKHFKEVDYITNDAVLLDRKIMADIDFKGLTLREICTAITNGAAGDYGECKSITVEWCLRCLRLFINNNREVYERARKVKDSFKKDQRLQNVLDWYARSMAKANEERMKKEKEKEHGQ